ncbi:MAG: hypothetical protein PUF31_06385 [Oscillospiraceae bacterium]|nr:hypothetical protein [Oscillospiraceae bacterium]
MKPAIRIGILLFLLLTVCAFFGCAPEKADPQSDSMNIDVITASDGQTYTVKNGRETVSFRVEDGKPVEVGITVKKQSGTLGIRIEKNGEEKPIYQGKDLPSSQFTVTADKAGAYTVTVEAENFIGEYRTELNTDGD